MSAHTNTHALYELRRSETLEDVGVGNALMDSGNSGSMQSSSTAGDEEYDSRAESSSLSAFLNNTNNNSNPVPPPQQHTITTTLTQVGPFTHVFDPLSNYMDPTQRTPSSNQNQILNLDMVWSKVAAARSEPDLSGAGLIPCSSSSFPQNNTNNNHQAFLLSQLGPSQSQTQVNVGLGVFPTTLVSENGGNIGSSREPTSTNANVNVNAARNPKKRSRASRRAPTTVLTTDTSNFRAMVQEFTGIPAPPFTSSPFPRTRLDLFTSSSPIMRSSTHLPNGTLDPPTTSTTPAPYLLRPFAHKVQSQPSIPPMLDTLASHHNNSSTNNNFHNPLNMHNPILSLQSMLQSPPKYQQQQQQAALEIAPSGVDSSHLRMGGLEELGLSHAHVSGHHHNMVQSSSDGALSRVNNNNNNLHNSISAPSSAEWAQAQRIDHNDGGVLRSLNYRSNVPDQRVSNGKVNFSSGGASDFHGDKGPECGVAARSEGMVESWINCSSD